MAGEQQNLARQLRLELGELLRAQQAALGAGPGGAGLPLVTPTRAPGEVERQQKVVRAVLANLQMYRAAVAQGPLRAEVMRRQGWLATLREEVEGRKKGKQQQAGGQQSQALAASAGGKTEARGAGGRKPREKRGAAGAAGGGGSGGGVATRAKRSAAAAAGGGANKSQRTTGGRRGGRGGEQGSPGGGEGGEGGAQDRRAILRNMMKHFQGS